MLFHSEYLLIHICKHTHQVFRLFEQILQSIRQLKLTDSVFFLTNKKNDDFYSFFFTRTSLLRVAMGWLKQSKTKEFFPKKNTFVEENELMVRRYFFCKAHSMMVIGIFFILFILFLQI
jgi:hypothetical protein